MALGFHAGGSGSSVQPPNPNPVTFTFVNHVESYTVPKTGIYKLEVWGAEGGGDNCLAVNGGTNLYSKSGKGGYAKGNVTLYKNEIIYVCVGGQGNTYTIPMISSADLFKADGGYNGGGDGYSRGRSDRLGYSAGGGGATHIGRSNAVLKETASSNVLIVAGGGGGGGTTNGTIAEYGGSGGGVTAGNGSSSNSQTAAGGGGSYGQGSYYNVTPYGGGGGGGGYAGGAAYYTSGGGGGTGYISSEFIGGTTEMTNGLRSGNGQAVITWVSEA